MRMRVNEAGEKRGVTEIDDFRAGGDGCAGADAGDFAAGDDHEAGRDNGIALAIEQPSCLQDVSFFGRFFALVPFQAPTTSGHRADCLEFWRACRTPLRIGERKRSRLYRVS